MLQLPAATVLDPVSIIDPFENKLAVGGLRHRASSCYWNGQMFSLLPRAAEPDFAPTVAHSLDLQINAVTPQTVNSPNDAPFTLASSYQTFPLVSSVPVGSRMLTAMAAGDLGAAYAFWLVMPGDGKNTLYSFTPSIDASGALSTPWDQSKVLSTAVDGLGGIPITDFACASVGSTVYFVCSVAGGGSVRVFSYREGAFSACATLALSDDEIMSLDLTAVTQPVGASATGGAPPLQQQLAFVALTSGQPGLICKLIGPAQLDALIAGTAPAPALGSLALPPPPGFSALNMGPGPMIQPSNEQRALNLIASHVNVIRACWGTARSDTGDPISNGLLLAHIGVMPFAIGSTAHMTVVDLSSSSAYAWSDVTLKGTASYVGNLATFFPIAVANSFADGSAQASYSAVFAACAWAAQMGPFGPAAWAAQIVPSHKLTSGGDALPFRTDPTADDGSLGAAVSAWLLLGVVTGLPPYPGNAKSGGVSLSFGQSSKSGTSASVTSKKSGTFGAEAGGDVFSLGGSVTDAVSDEDETGSSWSVSVDYSWSNGKDADPDTGWLIVAQPDYLNQQYSMTTWGGAAAGITLNVLWSTGASLAYYPFKLTAPNTLHLHSDSAVLKRLCTFPLASGAAVSWPKSNDIAGWSKQSVDTAAWGLSDYAGEGSPLQIIEATSSGSLKLSIVSSSDLKLTTGSEVTISVDAGIDLEIIKIKASGEYAVEHSVTNSFSKDNSIEIEYEQLTPAKSTKDGFNVVSIQPYLYQCTKDSVPWVPTIFARQRPWLLTWRVTRAV